MIQRSQRGMRSIPSLWVLNSYIKYNYSGPLQLGAVTKLTIQIALDGFLRSRKKTQPYRGTARLSDEEIGKPDKQDV